MGLLLIFYVVEELFYVVCLTRGRKY